VKAIVPYPANGPSTFAPKHVVATSRGTAIVSSEDTSGTIQGAIYEVDLASGATVPVQLGIFRFLPTASLLAASPDGKRVYIADDGSAQFSGGYFDVWQADADTSVKTRFYTGGVYQLATDDTGDAVLRDCCTYDPMVRQLSSTATPTAWVNFRNLVPGEKLHSSGSLAYVPTTIGLEVYDIHHGDRALSIGINAGSAVGPDNLAVDHAGTRLYVAEPQGIGVIDLENAPLSIGSLTPDFGDASGGDTVVLRGSGFQSGTTVSFGDRAATSVQFIDSTKLVVTTPNMIAMKNLVSVHNPDGTAYTLDAAYDASSQVIPAPPVLASVTPNNVPVGGGYQNFVITGKGFVPGAVVMLNGANVSTSYGDSTQITAYLLRLPGPGQQAISVLNPRNPTASNLVYITTHTEAAALSSIKPSTIGAGAGDFYIDAFGDTTLESTTKVLWNGSPLATTYVDPNHVFGKVPAALVAKPGTAAITVQTPGYAASSAVAFTIEAPMPLITPDNSSVAFGSVLIGGTSQISVPIHANGNVAVGITAFTLSDSQNFSQTNNCPTSLPLGKSCTVTINFTPTTGVSTSSPVNATLTISSFQGKAQRYWTGWKSFLVPGG
jgi:hypothetical protein